MQYLKCYTCTCYKNCFASAYCRLKTGLCAINATVQARNIAWKNWRTVGEPHIGITVVLFSYILPFTLAISLIFPNTLPRKMSDFQKHLETLEMEAKQTLQSLLSAPMQRITKLPLLMKEIQKRAPNDHPSHEHMKSCHKAVEKVFIYNLKLSTYLI